MLFLLLLRLCGLHLGFKILKKIRIWFFKYELGRSEILDKNQVTVAIIKYQMHIPFNFLEEKLIPKTLGLSHYQHCFTSIWFIYSYCFVRCLSSRMLHFMVQLLVQLLHVVIQTSNILFLNMVTFVRVLRHRAYTISLPLFVLHTSFSSIFFDLWKN